MTLSIGGDRQLSLPTDGFVAETIPETGDELVLGVRPEHFVAGAPADGDHPTFDVTIALEERLGRETILYADSTQLKPILGEQPHIIVQQNVQATFSTGDRTRLSFDPASVIVFRGDGGAIRWGPQTGRR